MVYQCFDVFLTLIRYDDHDWISATNLKSEGKMHKAILIQRTIGIIVILSIILGGPVVSSTVRAQQAGADRLPDQIQSPDAVWGFTDVDNNNAEVGYYTSMALDAEGKPHISYFDAISQELKYASYSGSTWGWEVVDNAVNPGQRTGGKHGNPGYIKSTRLTTGRLPDRHQPGYAELCTWDCSGIQSGSIYHGSSGDA